MKTIKMNLVAAVVALSAATVFAENTVTVNGSQVVVNVDTGNEMTISEAFAEGVTSFLKTGGGTLTLEAGNSGLSGDAEIREGVVIMKHKDAFGRTGGQWEAAATRRTKLKNGGAIIVQDGAQLQIKTPMVEQWDVAVHKRMVLNGTGTDGKGAVRLICQDAWKNMDHFLAYVELAGDAYVSCENSCRYGIDMTDLKGHELTVNNPYQFFLSGSYHFSAGTFHVIGATLWITGDSTFCGGSAGILKLDGCSLNYTLSTAFPWGIEVPAGKDVTLTWSGAWTAAGKNRFTGPLKVDGNLTFKAGTSTGSIRLEGSGEGSAATGKIYVQQGIVEFAQPATLPNYATAGSVVVNSVTGRLRLPVGANGWDAASFKTAADNATYVDNACKLTAYTAAGEDITNTLDMAGRRLGHDGAGTFTFAGGIREDGNTILSNCEGTFRITGNTLRYAHYLFANGGTMLFEDAGLVFDGDSTSSTSWGEWYVGNSGVAADAPAKMVLKGASSLGANPDSAWGVLKIGETASQGAILEMHAGATLTNTFSIGEAAKAKGAIHQYGGSVRLITPNNAFKYIGLNANSYGYYGISGGSLYFKRNLVFASAASSVGIMDIGGDARVTANSTELKLGYAGWGEIYMNGGRLSLYTNNGTTLPHILGVTGGTGTSEDGQAVLTLDGPGNPTIEDTWWGWLQLCQRTTNYTAIVNLNAGVANMNHIKRAASTADASIRSKAYLNFNGGTFKTFTTTALFGTGDTALDRVTIFEGGATIETPYQTKQAADTPFVAPSGRGIAAIALPANHENGKYIGPPEVRISGGGGAGATAHALYDPLTLSVTNIVVTCPGWDYTNAPTVTICSSDRTVTNTCAVTLTEGTPKGGGLVKKGTNNLHLNAVNTYAGDTELQDGLLYVNVPGAVPTNSTFVLHGGNYVIASGVANPTNFAVDAHYIYTRGTEKTTWCSINFTGATLEIRNLNTLPDDFGRLTLLKVGDKLVTGNPTLTGDWDRKKIRVYRSGNTWRAVRVRGFMLYMR